MKDLDLRTFVRRSSFESRLGRDLQGFFAKILYPSLTSTNSFGHVTSVERLAALLRTPGRREAVVRVRAVATVNFATGFGSTTGMYRK